MKKDYFPFIDLLRFAAALSVMFFHYFGSLFNNSNNILAVYISHGYLGVELFFMISGFVIFFSLYKGTKAYAIGRLVRLYPLFWICCTLTYLVTIWFNADPLPFTVYLKNLLLINNNQTATLVDGVYWTLTQEVIFYALIGVFVYLWGMKRIEWFFGLWIAFAYIVFAFNLEHFFIAKIALARYAGFFSIGGLTALIYTYRHTMSKGVLYLRSALLASALVLPIFVSERLKIHTTSSTNLFGIFDTSGYIILLVLTILFFAGVIYNRETRFARIALVLGAMTYPLYLLHYKIGETIINLFEPFGNISTISITVIISIILLSYIMSIFDKKMRFTIMQKIKKIC